MDRVDFYFKQTVTEAEMDSAFDDVENAMWNISIDIGLLGVITGAVISETSPQSMNVEASNPCRGYDQLGRRLYFGALQTVNCALDKDNNPTIPSTGNSRWIMLQLIFDRALSDARTDGNGATVYYERDESFSIEVIAGAESSGTPTRPTAPSDALILCDIRIYDTTTQITNAMIDTTRRQDFAWTSADKISVSAGSWTNIDNTSDHVQDALDSVDDELIARDGSGNISENLIPDTTATYDLGESSTPLRWDGVYAVSGDFSGAVAIGGNLTMTGNILAAAGGEDIGDATKQFDAHLGTATVYTKIAAAAGGEDIGDSTNKFDAHLDNVTIYTKIAAADGTEDIGDGSNRFNAYFNTAYVYTKLEAGAAGADIGDATNQFDAFLQSITHYGALAGTHQFSAAKAVTVMIPVSDFTALGGTGWDWNSTATNLEDSTGSKVMHIRFNLPDGVTMTSMRIRWSQSTTGDMSAQIESLDEDNAATSVGSSKTPTTYDGTTIWDTIASGLSEVAARATKYHRVKVTSGSGVNKVYMLEVTYNVTDILKGALKNCS